MSEIKDFDSFWIEQGQTLVKETFKNLNKRLSNYAAYLKYLKGFFIIGSLVSAGFYQTTNPYVFASFILPMIILYLAGFQISVGDKIPLEKLDLRSPLSINDTFYELVRGLKDEVEKAKTWVTVATFAVLIGGSFAIYCLNKENVTKQEISVLKQEKKVIKKADNEIKNEFRKNQKFHVTTDKDNNKITISAKLIETKIYIIKYIDSTNKPDEKSIKIPKYTDFERDIDNVKQLIEIEEKSCNK